MANELDDESRSWGTAQRERLQKIAPRTRIHWWAVVSGFIEPGRDLSPFSIQSGAKPGIIEAYFRGLGASISTREGWDLDVSGQLGSLTSKLNDSISMPLLGPKFATTATSEAIARDYLAAIDRLSKESKLS